MLAAGWDHINMDDCWGATNVQYPGGERGNGTYRWDPERFPSGIPALASWLHDRGFKFGLYTASGNSTCSDGGRKGYVPGSVGHFTEDAQTFADWGVGERDPYMLPGFNDLINDLLCALENSDYVKLDWCLDKTVTSKMNLTVLDALRKNRTDQMAIAMNKTGRPMWLTFHCVYKKFKTGQDGSFQQWCADDGNSWRIGPDHHDNFDSLQDVIEILAANAEHGRRFRWNDPGKPPGRWREGPRERERPDECEEGCHFLVVSS